MHLGIDIFSACFVQEIKFEPNVMCEPIDKKLTFRASQVTKNFFYSWFSRSCSLFDLTIISQLEDGDIVCFQKAPAIDSDEQVRYPDVPSYLEYVHNRQVYSMALINVAIYQVYALWTVNWKLSIFL